MACLVESCKELSFGGTHAYLKKLQDVLRCHNATCHQKEDKELYSLGVCEHRFCKSCVDEIKGSSCPICLMPCRSTKIHVDKQLSSISLLCVSLKNILAGRPDDESTTIASCYSIEEEITDNKAATPPNVQSLAPKVKSSTLESNLSSRGRRKSTPLKTSKSILQAQADEMKTSLTPQTRARRSVSKLEESKSSDVHETKAYTPRRGRGLSIERREPGVQPNSENKDESGFKKSKTPSLKRKSGSIDEPKCKNENKGKMASDQCDLNNSDQVEASKDIRSPKDRILKNKAKGKSLKRNYLAALEKRNIKGETQLQVAAVKADFKRVKELLEGGANPNVKDNAKWTPLHEAVNHGNSKIAELLLDYGASINAPASDNETPLHDAVNNHNLECVKLLVKRGANILARTSHGQTALDLAKSEDMKEALLMSTNKSVSPCEESFMEDGLSSDIHLCFKTSSISKEDNMKAQKLAKLLDAKFVDNNVTEVSHCINGVNEDGLCVRTLKFLSALVQGAWIVNDEWLHECTKIGQKIPEEAFEIPGCITTGKNDAPQRARLNSSRKLPGLFDGCQFFFHGKFLYPCPSKEELTMLAKLGGGTILTREPRLHKLDDYPYTVPYHAGPQSSLADCAIFVIYDDACLKPPHVKAQRMSYLPASWFLDSISSFTLQEKTDYLRL